MKAVLLALGTLGLSTQPPPAAAIQAPGPRPEHPPVAGREHPPLLLGETTSQAILAHRAIYRENLAKVNLSNDLKARWKAVRRPFTLVAVFGSWCSDSHHLLPDLLALDAEPNPFVEVRYLGVNRDKVLAGSAWPKGLPAQKLHRVPTFYLFATQPGGGMKLAGSIVETPPRAGQSLAEAVVELLEAASRSL